MIARLQRYLIRIILD